MSDELFALITLQIAAEMLGQSEDTVRRRIADGTLPAFRIKNSRGIRVNKADVKAMLIPVPTANGTVRP